MPREYALDSRKPRLRVTLAPSPTMMDDRIGIIGNTQGVNERPRPSRKKAGTISISLPPPSKRARLPSSDTGAGLTGAAATGAGTGANLTAGAAVLAPGMPLKAGAAVLLPIRRALASWGA